MNNISETSYIKFDNQNEYNQFINKLTNQVKSYTEESCLSNGIRLGSSDAKVIEEVISDVFLKHTIELMRPNLSISGTSIPTPQDFQNTKTSKSLIQPDSSLIPITVKDQTKPIDSSLTERVVRQQYAVNEAAVDNSRKRKALPNHLISLVENQIQENSLKLNDQIQIHQQIHQNWLKDSIEIDPKNRWKIINDQVNNIEQVQEDYTTTGLILSNLLTKLPSIVDQTERVIELEETLIKSF